MKVKWHGTASIEMINEQGGKILFDPFVPLKHCGIPVSIKDYDGFSDILITHGHFDHIVSLPEIVKRNPNVKIYCTVTPYRTLSQKGISGKNLVNISYDREFVLNGFKIRTYHGKHAVLPSATISRVLSILKSPAKDNLPFIIKENHLCKENDETIFYEIEAEGKRIALLGSLNLRPEISYPEGMDVLILPYNGWEDNYPPAVSIIKRLKPQKILLDHYDDSFPPITTELNLEKILNYKETTVAALELGRTENV